MSELEENLVETRNSLMKEISSLSHEEFNKKLDENYWSIAQICCHLVLSERTFANAIDYGLKKSKSNQVEQKNMNRVLDRSKKIEAPEMLIPKEEPIGVPDAIDLLNDSRNNLMSVLNKVEDQSILKEKSVKHPFFDYLALNQWAQFVYLHEQRHIDQIKEIKKWIGVED